MGVRVGVSDGIGVAVGTRVSVAVGSGVRVGFGEGVLEGSGVGVIDAVGVTLDVGVKMTSRQVGHESTRAAGSRVWSYSSKILTYCTLGNCFSVAIRG